MVSDLIVDFFVKYGGVDVVFGIIGSANSYLYDSFSKKGVRIVNVHHEQTAVMAAGSYYRTCGKIAIALVTAGAGATNAVTGIVGAWADSIPVIILSGQESSKYLESYKDRRMYGTQGLDFVHMVSKVSKLSKTTTLMSLQDDLEHALWECTHDRPGPVVLDIPFDVQSGKVILREWEIHPNIRTQPSVQSIEYVETMLRSSKRPLILAGHGVKLSGAKSVFADKFASKFPFVLSWSSIDLIGHDSDMYFGMPGIYGRRAANHIVQMCDLLIVLGSRLALPQTGYDTDNYAKNAKIVVVDVDPTENKPFYDYYIQSDCLEFMNRVNVSENADYSDWIYECKRVREKYPIIESCHENTRGYTNSYRVINMLSNHIKPNTIIVTDMGTALLSGHQAIRLNGSHHTMFTSYGLGEMGHGLPAAIGAAFAFPDRPVLCLNCDGSMMMNLQELQTIKQHNLNIKIVVFNNDGYLMIKHTQKMLFNGKYTAVNSDTGVVLPDYIKLGCALGYTICNLDDDCTGPCMCEVRMDPEQDFLPKLKGVLRNNGVITPPEFHELSPLPPQTD